MPPSGPPLSAEHPGRRRRTRCAPWLRPEEGGEERGGDGGRGARLWKDGGGRARPAGPRTQGTGSRGQREGHPRKRAEFPRAARSPRTARQLAASGKLRDSRWGPRQRRLRPPPALAQPGRLGSQRSGRAPPGRGCRAQSWAAGTVTRARRTLCCAPLRAGGRPSPAVPGPAASIRPQPPAQREIKPPPIPLHASGET